MSPLVLAVAGAAAGLAAIGSLALAESAFAALGAPPPADAGPSAASGPAARLRARPERLQHALALLRGLALAGTGAAAWLVARAATGEVRIGSEVAAPVVAALLAVLVDRAAQARGARHPAAWARRAAPAVQALAALLAPLLALSEALARAAARVVGAGPAASRPTSDDLRALFEDTSARTDLGTGERQMIASIFDFGETTVREVMTPRTDVFAVDGARPIAEIVAAVRAAEHSRVPVRRGSLDEITGVLYAKDLLAVAHGLVPPPALEAVLRPVAFVPEGKRIDDLLRQFQRERIHVAIVVDEYGGTAGIVTLEDVLEELVGEIQDENDEETPLVEPLSEGALRIDGRLDADDFAELTGSIVEAEGVETIGGAVARELGRVARVGDEVELSGWRFRVEEVEGKRIVKVVATPEPPADLAEAEEAP